MKKLYVIFAGVLLAMLFAYGCDGAEPVAEPAAAEFDPATVEGDLETLNQELSIFRLSLVEIGTIISTEPIVDSGDCPAVEWSINWETLEAEVVLDYGEGCEFLPGMEASGAIVVQLMVGEASLPVTSFSDDFAVNGYHVNGEVATVFSLIRAETNGELAFHQEGGSTHVLTLVDCILDVQWSFEWPFDEEEISATLQGAMTYFVPAAAGEEPEGAVYSVVIPADDPLTFVEGCPYPVSGRIEVSFVLYVPMSAWVDFGYPDPGACDDQFDFGFAY